MRNIPAQFFMDIIKPLAIRRRTLALRGHFIRPEKRFITLRALDFQHETAFSGEKIIMGKYFLFYLY
jgi:hypothetical protein